MGGHVAKKLGDGLMALFGYPVAQENDAERAVRAALSIQRALAEVNRKNAGLGKPPLEAPMRRAPAQPPRKPAGELFRGSRPAHGACSFNASFKVSQRRPPSSAPKS